MFDVDSRTDSSTTRRTTPSACSSTSIIAEGAPRLDDPERGRFSIAVDELRTLQGGGGQ